MSKCTMFPVEIRTPRTSTLIAQQAGQIAQHPALVAQHSFQITQQGHPPIASYCPWLIGAGPSGTLGSECVTQWSVNV